jgi:hypothetical protein
MSTERFGRDPEMAGIEAPLPLVPFRRHAGPAEGQAYILVLPRFGPEGAARSTKHSPGFARRVVGVPTIRQAKAGHFAASRQGSSVRPDPRSRSTSGHKSRSRPSHNADTAASATVAAASASAAGPRGFARSPTWSVVSQRLSPSVHRLAAKRHLPIVLLDYWSVWLGGQYAARRLSARPLRRVSSRRATRRRRERRRHSRAR